MLKRYQPIPYSKHKPCYFCGAEPPSTREHIPPKFLFNGFVCDSITVPSCHLHNTNKNLRDRAVITALMLCTQAGKNAEGISENIKVAIEKLEPNLGEAKNQVRMLPFLQDPPEGLEQPLPYIQPTVDIRNWIRQLTAGLVWNLNGEYEPSIDWNGITVWSPIFFPTSNPIKTEDAISKIKEFQQLEQTLRTRLWIPGWTSLPRHYPHDIYNFEVSFSELEEDKLNVEVLFRHNFYNKLSWYVLFDAKYDLAEKIYNTSMAFNSTFGTQVDGVA